MATIFRIHNSKTGSKNTIEDWGISDQYNLEIINSIEEPDGARHNITSIPSPFARFDLAKTSLEYVSKKDKSTNKYENIERVDNVYNKMVSDILDIGYIFYNWNIYKDKFELIQWNRSNAIKELSTSGNDGHKALSNTYDLFLHTDAKGNNFDKLSDIYLLRFKGDGEMTIVGATCPTTLFIPTPNKFHEDSSFISEIRLDNTRHPFVGCVPLHRRDIEYHKWWQAMRKSIKNFAKLYPEMEEYLVACFNESDKERKRQLEAIDNNTYGLLYKPLMIKDGQVTVQILQDNLNVLGEKVLDVNSCDFRIKPSRELDIYPLVLPAGTGFNRDWKYIDGKWDRNTKVPYKESNDITSRELPSTCYKYPYLTISDFLEDNILKFQSNAIDKDFFFNCNPKNAENGIYLTPLKKEFFKYFTVEDLSEYIGERKMLTIEPLANGIKVILRIPVINNDLGYIEYSRIYNLGMRPKVTSNENQGGVVEVDDDELIFTLFPLVKFLNTEKVEYKIGVLTDRSSDLGLSCGSYSDSLEMQQLEYTQREASSPCIFTHNKNFDFIEIKIKDITALIIPMFKERSANTDFAFSIDFGTTNTHVEYVTGNLSADSNPLDITDSDKQLIFLTDRNQLAAKEKYVFEADMIPSTIGINGSLFRFPIRTAMLYSKNIKSWANAKIINDTTFSFTYEKRSISSYNKVVTNIKWNDGAHEDHTNMVRLYLKNLFYILRNKVLLNDGRLDTTKIVWTFPISMKQANRDELENNIKEIYSEYFTRNVDNVSSLSESVAPYLQIKEEKENINNIVTIDIGGGTSDVVFANNGEIQLITSFRFAADAIFGDAYTSGAVRNSLVKSYANDIKSRVLIPHQLTETINIFDVLYRGERSCDLASFLFSLTTNEEIIKKNLVNSVDLLTLIRTDKDRKIVVLLFYTAIIYHIAKMMKIKSLEKPRHLAFTGNGSKVISALTTNSKTLSEYTKLIIEKVYNEQYGKDGLDVIYFIENTNSKISLNPKEKTCRGAIKFLRENNNNGQYQSVDDKIFFLDPVNNRLFKRREIEYSSIDDAYINDCVSSVNEFIEVFLSLDKDFSFEDKFSISLDSINKFKEEAGRDLVTFMRNGMSKLGDSSNAACLSETTFFYPIIGMIHSLSNKL